VFFFTIFLFSILILNNKPKPTIMRRKLFFLLSFITVLGFFIACTSNESKEQTATTSTSTTEDSAKAVLARGDYLVNNVSMCLVCHSERDATKFGMPVKPGTEGGGAPHSFGESMGIPGEITPPNITPFGLKDWTTDDIIKAITAGINKKGDTLFPLMPYHSYSRLAKDDIQSIAAYIHSLKPIENTTPPKKLMITPAMYGPLPVVNLDQNKRPDPSDKVKYGEYLVTAAVCSDCHTPMTPQGAPDFSKAFSGGFHFKNPVVDVTVANITPDSTTGIGSWTEEVFLAKFKTNLAATEKGDNPGKLQTEMPWGHYAKMKDEDLKAIYAYLRTVPPVKNKVVKWASAPDAR
jgi:mono/diheme cytochrome c family protein